MPVYNGAKYLREAVDSILGQTFTDFEFIVIDDGSTDGSAETVESYDDPRIRLLRNGANFGLVKTLNKGIEMASGEYIARMDCDDVSLPERLARQVAFMDSNLEVAASGTWAKDVDARGRVISAVRKPVGEQMEYEFWRPSPLYHSSAMIRVSHLGDLRYDPGALHVEDYDLWLRLRKRHRLDNVPEFLLLYRVHEESVSVTNFDRQLRAAHEVFRRHVGPEVSFEGFCELIGFSRNFNPLRRALLTRRLAGLIGKPYRSFLRGDVEYAKDWLAPRLTLRVMKLQVRRPARYLRRLAEGGRAKESAGGKDRGCSP
jgi:glycosyltransferase involved in cell wall biosynthesis